MLMENEERVTGRGKYETKMAKSMGDNEVFTCATIPSQPPRTLDDVSEV